MTDTTEPVQESGEVRREFDMYTREQLIAEINRLRAVGWKRDTAHSDFVTAVSPLVRAALKVVGDERGMSENEADYEALTDASARVPWAAYDELGIDAGALL